MPLWTIKDLQVNFILWKLAVAAHDVKSNQIRDQQRHHADWQPPTGSSQLSSFSLKAASKKNFHSTILNGLLTEQGFEMICFSRNQRSKKNHEISLNQRSGGKKLACLRQRSPADPVLWKHQRVQISSKTGKHILRPDKAEQESLSAQIYQITSKPDILPDDDDDDAGSAL